MMDIGIRNLKGRVVYRGPRGGLYILRGGKKVYKRKNEKLIRYPTAPKPGGKTRFEALINLR